MTTDHDADGVRLPIKIDATSNGEFAPCPLEPRNRTANRLALDWAATHARRLGVSRRAFLMSGTGAASTLLAINHVNAMAGKSGGFYDIAAEAALDADAAAAALQGREFIFDVQGHYVDHTGAWIGRLPEGARPLAGFRGNSCMIEAGTGDLSYIAQCFSREAFLKDVFLDSDTDMMVLSFTPSRREAPPLTIEEADAARRIVDAMEGNHRLLLHGRVNPNQDGDMGDMDELAEKWGVAAWKTYTQWGPDGGGFYLYDEAIGLPFIEKARALGVPIIAIHKGLPFGRRSYEHSRCDDIGVVAKMFPDVKFLIYHAGFDTGVPEQAFAPGAGRDGIDSLVQSLIDNGVAPGSNVYAELGSTWRFLMRDPDQAAHAMGKLITYCGEDNVLWGTDSIWYGSPQDQIQAFRTFQIAPEYRDRYGYPEMTPALRAKIFGLNAAKVYGVGVDEVVKRAAADPVSRLRQAYGAAPDPHYLTYGPKTRREFLAFRRLSGGEP